MQQVKDTDMLKMQAELMSKCHIVYIYLIHTVRNSRLVRVVVVLQVKQQRNVT